MGLLPKIDLDIAATVGEFLTVLRAMNAKLDTLIELQTQAVHQAAGAERLEMES